MRRSILDDARDVLDREYHDIDAPARLARFARKVDRETRAAIKTCPTCLANPECEICEYVLGARAALGLPPIKD